MDIGYDRYLDYLLDKHLEVPSFYKQCLYCVDYFDPEELNDKQSVSDAFMDIIDNDDVVEVLVDQLMEDDSYFCNECLNKKLKGY